MHAVVKRLQHSDGISLLLMIIHLKFLGKKIFVYLCNIFDGLCPVMSASCKNKARNISKLFTTIY